jgi:hypothetical protein
VDEDAVAVDPSRTKIGPAVTCDVSELGIPSVDGVVVVVVGVAVVSVTAEVRRGERAGQVRGVPGADKTAEIHPAVAIHIPQHPRHVAVTRVDRNPHEVRSETPPDAHLAGDRRCEHEPGQKASDKP